MKEQKRHSKPEASSPSAQRELDRAAENFDAFDKNVKEMTLDRMNAAPKEETEQQTKLSNREMQNSKDIYLKPLRSIDAVDPKTGIPQKFNEKFRKDWEFQKEIVQFFAEHREITGEKIEIWTRPFGGVPAEFWEVPPNKPVWGPRYLAEQIKRCTYHRLVMEESRASNLISGDGRGEYYGSIAADTIVQRLDAHPVSQKKSLFMGAVNF